MVRDEHPVPRDGERARAKPSRAGALRHRAVARGHRGGLRGRAVVGSAKARRDGADGGVPTRGEGAWDGVRGATGDGHLLYVGEGRGSKVRVPRVQSLNLGSCGALLALRRLSDLLFQLGPFRLRVGDGTALLHAGPQVAALGEPRVLHDRLPLRDELQQLRAARVNGGDETRAVLGLGELVLGRVDFFIHTVPIFWKISDKFK